MADIILGLTGTAELDDSVVLAFDQAYVISSGQTNVMDQFAQMKTDIGAKSIQMTKYARLAVNTTPLSERETEDSTAMSDSPILFTPAHYGNVVTTTELAQLQTGGKANRAAAELIGINQGETTDKLALLALDGATQVRFGGVQTSAGAVTATDIVNTAFLDALYNKLSRTNTAKINGGYVAVLHDDNIGDIRTGAAVGDWTDVVKYSTPETALQNEVGMFKGFRIIRDNNATIVANGGSGNVDLYNSYFFGANAFGKATSMTEQLFMNDKVVNDPYDLYVNIGWKGVFDYGIIDTSAVWVGKTASSIGDNV